MGSRVFDLGFSHVLDAKGQRSGTIVEWLDRTDELSAQAAAAAVVPRTRACARHWTPARPT